MDIMAREDWIKATLPDFNHTERVVEGLRCDLAQLGETLSGQTYNPEGRIAARFTEEIKGLNHPPRVATVYHLQELYRKAGWTLTVSYEYEPDQALEALLTLTDLRNRGKSEVIVFPELKERKLLRVHYTLWLQNGRL